ncbi:MAG TPA: adenylate/guanylate cyclase domain-containing protein [Candidatus Dormibacteraeota bacterium]|nr:adenylate/guanylate cyclase domain-containing protein [Candidatus Dormibacteraeota bacterium]
MPLDDRVKAGLTALDRHAWRESYDLLKAADTDGLLGAPELERLGLAAWWLGRLDDSLETTERAYEAHIAAGDHQAAAHVAIELARGYAWKSARSVSMGWLARAAHLVESHPNSPALAEMLLARAQAADAAQDLDAAETLAAQALEAAHRFGLRDEAALAMEVLGSLLARRGEVARGFELVDESTAMAVGGELSARTTGVVYCQTIALCHDLGDFERAGEWTEAATRWCERRSIAGGFPGVCRVHRAEMLRLRGAWERATSEAVAACEELPGYNPQQAGAAFGEMGELRLRMGDLEGAEEAFRRAHELGAGQAPGSTLLQLARGDKAGAAAAIRRALDSVRDRVSRGRLLPAQVEIAVAGGDLETAEAASEELARLADDFGRPLFVAEAATAAGRLALARGRAAEATRELLAAVRAWMVVDAPFEGAQSRLLLAKAHAAEGDLAGARLELETAKAIFERLGAPTAALEAGRLLDGLTDERATVTAGHRAYLFTDIVNSTNLVEVIGDDAWSELVGWHDRAMRELFAQQGARDVETRGDGFFAIFGGAAEAADCAIAIQRALADHRRHHGFAPKVRIGLHAAASHRVEEGYHGAGVHVAARIAALAEGDQILASTSSLDGLSGLELSDRRHVRLKGIRDPVEVAAIAWR